MLYLQEKDFKKAEMYFSKANSGKDHPTYLLNLGHAYANQNLLDRAEECYVKSLEINSNSLIAWKSIGSLYQFQKRFTDSIKIWEKIIQNYSRDPFYKIQLAKDLIELKEFKYALNILSGTSDFEKYQELAWYYTAVVHLNSKNFGLAETAINKSLALQPDNESFRILAATIYLGLSQLGKALFHWNYLLRIDETNHKVRTDKAVALLAHGFANDSLAELNIVISFDKNNTKALYYKALTLLELKGSKKEAVEILKTLILGDNDYSKNAKELLSKIEPKTKI
jgi:tetratricopeptide (TPR) repeat protein